jgi:diguanylate cyclase (GGDEF)-like protein
MRYITRLKHLAAPLAILLVAAAITMAGMAQTAGPVGYGPYGLLTIGALIALWFHRGQAFFALLSLLLAYAGLRFALDAGPFAVRATFTAAAVFVPLNILIGLMVPERGVWHFRSYRWLLLLALEATLTLWIASAGATPLSGTAWHALLDSWLFRPSPTPFLGRLLLAVALAVTIAKAWEEPTPLDVGIGGALIAFFAAFTWSGVPGALPVFLSAAGAILLIAVLQESHRMAFSDQLTGLPGRRALEDHLAALGPVYTIAMVDVDHFKKFNDTHGHDVGDQVLKLVGARLAEIGGRGRPFRYGGEEFSVLFAEKSVKEALPYLEQLRETIENYRLALRTGERRKESRSGHDRRAPPIRRKSGLGVAGIRSPSREAQDRSSLSVTVSIGVAERDEKLPTPPAVIRAADEALYRAKQSGRNRVSTYSAAW